LRRRADAAEISRLPLRFGNAIEPAFQDQRHVCRTGLRTAAIAFILVTAVFDTMATGIFPVLPS